MVVVVWWWWCGGGGGVVFFTDNNTTLRLHWVTLGCGNLEGSLEINIVFCSTIGKWFKNVTSDVNVHYVNCFVAIKKEKGAP